MYKLSNIFHLSIIISDEFCNTLEYMLINVGLFNPTSEAGKDVYIIYSNQDVNMFFSSDINEILTYVEECVAINIQKTDEITNIISDINKKLFIAKDSISKQDIIFEVSAYPKSPIEILNWINNITTDGKTIKFSKIGTLNLFTENIKIN